MRAGLHLDLFRREVRVGFTPRFKPVTAKLPGFSIHLGPDWRHQPHLSTYGTWCERWSLYIGWGLPTSLGEGECIHTKTISLSWTWLPRVLSRFDRTQASAWTGRSHRVVGWEWFGRCYLLPGA